MAQKAPNEQVPQLLAELMNRESNLKTIKLIGDFLNGLQISGRQKTQDLGRCFVWLDSITQGETARVEEIRKLLPDQDTEIKLGEAPKPEEKAVSVGVVELEKGSPVLGPS